MAHSLVKQLDPTVKSSIENQELHHRKLGLKEEFRRLAFEHGLDPEDWGQFENRFWSGGFHAVLRTPGEGSPDHPALAYWAPHMTPSGLFP